jgi:hypothetical protein
MDGSSAPNVRAALVTGAVSGAPADANVRLGDGERLRLSPTAAVRGGLLLLLLLRLVLCCLGGLFFLGGICIYVCYSSAGIPESGHGKMLIEFPAPTKFNIAIEVPEGSANTLFS